MLITQLFEVDKLMLRKSPASISMATNFLTFYSEEAGIGTRKNQMRIERSVQCGEYNRVNY